MKNAMSGPQGDPLRSGGGPEGRGAAVDFTVDNLGEASDGDKCEACDLSAEGPINHESTLVQQASELHYWSAALDYEAELGIVIGTR
jgi:hypothetical protein